MDPVHEARGRSADQSERWHSSESAENLMFWLREHGTLSGTSVAAALEAGTALAKVERLAAAWASERGASRVTAAA